MKRETTGSTQKDIDLFFSKNKDDMQICTTCKKCVSAWYPLGYSDYLCFDCFEFVRRLDRRVDKAQGMEGYLKRGGLKSILFYDKDKYPNEICTSFPK